MHVILIPGLWLDASSWDAVTPALVGAGHVVHALTMPGVGDPAPGDVGIDEWIAAVVRRVDELDGPIALVGHSGGGNVAWGAAEARAERLSRVVLVDTIAPPPGAGISEFPVVDGVVPFPGWDFFEDDMVFDLDEVTRARTAPSAHSVPARVPTDPIAYDGERRRQVPLTVLSGPYDEPTFRGMLAEWGPYAAEFDAVVDAEIVHIRTGHWPQFSAPDRLAAALVAVLR